MDIVMISGSCCIPSMANIDNAVRRLIDEAASATGTKVKVSAITASAAYGNDKYRGLIRKGITMSDAPVILLDGEVISYGVPKIEDLKSAFLKYSQKKEK